MVLLTKGAPIGGAGSVVTRIVVIMVTAAQTAVAQRGHEHRWNVRLEIGSVGTALILTSAAEVHVMNVTNQRTGSLKVRRRILS